MSKYIDSEILKSEMLKYGFRSVDQTVSEFIEDLPASDAEEVIHCKDCVYYEGILEDCCNVYYTRQDCPTNFVQEDDDYCSWGVRKEKE